MEKNFETLMEDKKFVEKIVKMESKEEVKKAFESEGVKITDEQLNSLGKMFNEIAEKLSTLNEDELQAVAGGGENPTGDGNGGLLSLFDSLKELFVVVREGVAEYRAGDAKIKQEAAEKAEAEKREAEAQKKSGMNIGAPIAGVVIGATAGAAYLYRDKIRKLWYKKR